MEKIRKSFYPIEFKKAIWNLYAQERNLEQLKRSIQELHGQGNLSETVADTRTVKRIIDDLQDADLAILMTLPEPVLALRHDYESVKAVLERHASNKDEEAEQAERSGHWPALRQAAKEAGEQLETPIAQLLGFPGGIPGIVTSHSRGLRTPGKYTSPGKRASRAWRCVNT